MFNPRGNYRRPTDSATEAHSFFVHNLMTGVGAGSPVDIIAGITDKLAQLTEPEDTSVITKRTVVTNDYIGNSDLEETGILIHTRKEEVIRDPVAWQICGDIVHVTITRFEYGFMNDFAAIPTTITTEVIAPVALVPNFDFGALAGHTNQYKILVVPDSAVPALMDIGVNIALYLIFTTCSFTQILATVIAGAHFVGIQYLLDIAPAELRSHIENAYDALISLRKRSHIVGLICNKLASIVNVNLAPEELATLGGAEASTLLNMRELIATWTGFATAHPPMDSSMVVRYRKVTHTLCGAMSQRTDIERVLTPSGNYEVTRKTTKPVTTSSILKWRRRFKMNAAAIAGKPVMALVGSEQTLGDEIEGEFSGTRTRVAVRVPSANWDDITSISALGDLVKIKSMSGYLVGIDYTAMLAKIKDAIRAPLPSVVKRDIVIDCSAGKYIETIVAQGLSRSTE